MQSPRPEVKTEPFRSSLLFNVLKVAILVILAAVLYLDVVRLPGAPAPGASVGFSVTTDQANWSVNLTALPSAKLPSEFFVLVRDPSGGIVSPRTSLENLTLAAWPRTHILYDKADASVPQVRPGDRLLLDRASYPSGHVVEISDDRSVLAIAALK